VPGHSTDLVRQKWLDNYFYGLTYSLNYDNSWMNFSVGGAVNRYDGDHYGKVIWVRNANGGGHVNASGCKFDDFIDTINLQEVRAYIQNKLNNLK
jgi:oligoribonuclease NrnB/cAMP/cGMP phosphodiesterase (DHH superfamily)